VGTFPCFGDLHAQEQGERIVLATNRELMAAARKGTYAVVREKMKLFGSVGEAR